MFLAFEGNGMGQVLVNLLAFRRGQSSTTNVCLSSSSSRRGIGHHQRRWGLLLLPKIGVGIMNENCPLIHPFPSVYLHYSTGHKGVRISNSNPNGKCQPMGSLSLGI
jgi:hypothetical protein